MNPRLLAWWVVGPLLYSSCTSEPESGPVQRARPVTVVALARTSPALTGDVTGIAKPYREEGVGFEVGGRVEFVIEVGDEVQGPTLDGDKIVVQEGDVLAKLDATRYQQALDVLLRRLDAADKGLEAKRIEAESVATSDLRQAQATAAGAAELVKATQADKKLAKFQLDRARDLFKDGNASQQDLDQRTAEFDRSAASHEAARNDAAAADAGVASAEANIELKRANLEKAKADIAELAQQRDQAQQDLDDCTLHAPYSGRVTRKHVGRGGYLRAGQQVITLTMMDVLQVTAAVTPEKSRKLLAGTSVALFPKDLDRFTSEAALHGQVYQKPEVADASTRTYLVDVIVRNLRRQRFVMGAGGDKVHAVDRVMPVVFEQRGVEGPLHVATQCVVEENGQDVVYLLPGFRMADPQKPDVAGTIKPRVVPVQLRDEFFTVINWTFQQIADGSDLANRDLLIENPRPEYLEGVAIARHDWAIRPGDLVPLSFEVGAAPSGLYAPAEAIRTLNGEASVFVVGDDNVARRMAVDVHETVGVRRRIEGDGLEAGSRVIVEGLHYVADGETVTVVAVRG